MRNQRLVNLQETRFCPEVQRIRTSCQATWPDVKLPRSIEEPIQPAPNPLMRVRKRHSYPLIKSVYPSLAVDSERVSPNQASAD